ncbi:hypothetical protein ACA910_013229 [Epithemia clementina (nom. ined.)]
MQSALFICMPPTAAGNAAAFQLPVLRADKMSPTQLEELLAMKKPVSLWGRMFSLLEAETMNEESVDLSVPDAWEDTKLLDSGEPMVSALNEDLKAFVPKMER